MKEKLLTALLLLFAVALCGTQVRAQPRRGKATPKTATRRQPPPKPAAKPRLPVPDMGTLADSTYTNKYFGLRMALPEGWNVHGEAVKAMLKERGKQLVTTDNAEVKKQIEALEQRTYNLLMLSKPPASEGGDPGPVFIIGAELIQTWVINSGSVYLTKAKEIYRYSQIKTEVEEDVRAVKMKGMDFGVMTIKITLPTVTVRQKFYATVKKDYALFFILSYSDAGELKALEDMVNSITWE